MQLLEVQENHVQHEGSREHVREPQPTRTAWDTEQNGCAVVASDRGKLAKFETGNVSTLLGKHKREQEQARRHVAREVVLTDEANAYAIDMSKMHDETAERLRQEVEACQGIGGTAGETQQVVHDMEAQFALAATSELQVYQAMFHAKNDFNIAITDRDQRLALFGQQLKMVGEDLQGLRYQCSLLWKSANVAKSECEWLKFIWGNFGMTIRQDLEPIANLQFGFSIAPVDRSVSVCIAPPLHPVKQDAARAAIATPIAQPHAQLDPWYGQRLGAVAPAPAQRAAH